MLIEAGLTAIALAVPFALPRLGSSWFSSIERAFASLAHRRGLAVTAVGLAALLLRLAILPFCPIPLPFIPDDFSFLLAANTFAQGRFTNPTPAMWMHFESIHITMQPTYTSMYFPSVGVVLAAGKVLFGQSLVRRTRDWVRSCARPSAGCSRPGCHPPGRCSAASWRLSVSRCSATGSTPTPSVAPSAALGGALVLGALPRL